MQVIKNLCLLIKILEIAKIIKRKRMSIFQFIVQDKILYSSNIMLLIIILLQIIPKLLVKKLKKIKLKAKVNQKSHILHML
jgi:predicted regulator of amino acid metabolism with ACT domain